MRSNQSRRRTAQKRKRSTSAFQHLLRKMCASSNLTRTSSTICTSPCWTESRRICGSCFNSRPQAKTSATKCKPTVNWCTTARSCGCSIFSLRISFRSASRFSSKKWSKSWKRSRWRIRIATPASTNTTSQLHVNTTRESCLPSLKCIN